MAYNTRFYPKTQNVLKKYNLQYADEIYPILGDTYPIKDELKAKGASFAKGINWFFTDKNEVEKSSYPYCTILIKDIIHYVGPNNFTFIHENKIKEMIDVFQPKN